MLYSRVFKLKLFEFSFAPWFAPIMTFRKLKVFLEVNAQLFWQTIVALECYVKHGIAIKSQIWRLESFYNLIVKRFAVDFDFIRLLLFLKIWFFARAIFSESFEWAYNFEKKVELVGSVIARHKMQSIFTVSRLTANHLEKEFWAASLAHWLQESSAPILACVVHKAHSSVFVFERKNFVFHH